MKNTTSKKTVSSSNFKKNIWLSLAGVIILGLGFYLGYIYQKSCVQENDDLTIADCKKIINLVQDEK